MEQTNLNMSLSQMIDALNQYYSGTGDPNVVPIWSKFNFEQMSYDEIEQFMQNIPQEYLNIDRSANGKIIGYSYADPISGSGTVPDNVVSMVNEVNSNFNPGEYSKENAFTSKIPATFEKTGNEYSVKSGSLNGLGSTVATIADRLWLGVVGVNIGTKLGRRIDQTIYNIDPDWWDNHYPNINPETWDSIAGSQGGKSFIRSLFGIQGNNMVCYIPENVLAYTYQMYRDLGLFNSNASLDGQTIELNETITPQYITGKAGDLAATIFGIQIPSSSPYYDFDAIVATYTNGRPCFISSDNVTLPDLSEVIRQNANGSYSLDPPVNIGSYAILQPNRTFTDLTIVEGGTGGEFDVTNSLSTIGKFIILGTAVPSPSTAQPGSTQYPPDSIDGTTPQQVLQQLKQTYPDLFNDSISEEVMQPDGNIERITYVPVPWGSEATEAETESQPQTVTQPVSNTLTNQAPDLGMKPDPMINIMSNPTVPNPETTTPDTPTTGTGDTPAIVDPITGSASSLWSVYNPSHSQINSFGAWLWSSDFVEQIKKLFLDPMQAIIGIHKVFVTPVTGGSQNIKCGYLDSGVSAKVVSNQYKTLNCGSVKLSEYFGNIFDYSPYTIVKIFLPFIGIVPLNVADIMRSTIAVKYTVDVITGACIAEVTVTRDGHKAVMYTYSGSAIVAYPLSSGSYAGIVSSVVSAAAGIAATALSGGSALPAVAGSVSSIMKAKTDVTTNGQFTGSAGAMGGKKPYLIITRPITRIADSAKQFSGFPSNHTVKINSCTGFIRCKEIHLCVNNAYKSELDELETLLKTGVLMDGVRANVNDYLFAETVPLYATVNRSYAAAGSITGYNPITVDVQPDLMEKSITENGQYLASNDGVDGYSEVTVNVQSSGGDVTLMSRAVWNSLTSVQKKSYGLVAIQDSNSGYLRGQLVYGADYAEISILQSNSGRYSNTIISQYTGTYNLIVLCLNSEASTKNIAITIKVNNTIFSHTDLSSNQYHSSGTNRRNYRLVKCPMNIVSGDEITVTVLDSGTHSYMISALTEFVPNSVLQVVSTADSAASGSYGGDAVVIYGTFNDSNSATMNVAQATANQTITTDYPGSSYASGYIFWVDLT